jgi:hypothetical protein
VAIKEQNKQLRKFFGERNGKCDVTVMAVKGKSIPLQALTGPEGSRRLRLPDFKTIGT